MSPWMSRRRGPTMARGPRGRPVQRRAVAPDKRRSHSWSHYAACKFLLLPVARSNLAGLRDLPLDYLDLDPDLRLHRHLPQPRPVGLGEGAVVRVRAVHPADRRPGLPDRPGWRDATARPAGRTAAGSGGPPLHPAGRGYAELGRPAGQAGRPARPGRYHGRRVRPREGQGPGRLSGGGAGMTENLAARESSAAEQEHLLRDWRSVILAPVGSGQRRRRGSDGVRLAAAVAALACCLLVIRFDSRVDRAITQVIHPPPWSITWLVTVVYQAGSFGVVIVLVALALLARRWEVARDLALSAAVAAAACGILIVLLGSRGGRPAGIVIGDYVLRFPVLQVAVFAAVATAALPYLARSVQRLIEIFIALVALASAVGGHGLPLNVLGSLAIGWGATALVRLIFGSPLGLPSTDDVRLLLAELGVRSSHVHPARRQVWGVAKFEATEICGTDSSGRIGIAVYGRDAADARLLTKAGRFLLYRDSGPSLTITRLQQVEHEAYVTMRAGLADVAVPEIVEAGTAGPSQDALLVYRMPPGTALSDTDAAEISDAMLDELYRQLLTLRRARIAHGAISGDAVLVDPVAGTVVLADFRNASVRASPDQLDRDLA